MPRFKDLVIKLCRQIKDFLLLVFDNHQQIETHILIMRKSNFCVENIHALGS